MVRRKVVPIAPGLKHNKGRQRFCQIHYVDERLVFVKKTPCFQAIDKRNGEQPCLQYLYDSVVHLYVVWVRTDPMLVECQDHFEKYVWVRLEKPVNLVLNDLDWPFVFWSIG